MVPVHTTCPVEGSVAITQHCAETSMETVYADAGAAYVALNAVDAVGATVLEAATLVGGEL
jgi:hypothetical protein